MTPFFGALLILVLHIIFGCGLGCMACILSLIFLGWKATLLGGFFIWIYDTLTE